MLGQGRGNKKDEEMKEENEQMGVTMEEDIGKRSATKTHSSVGTNGIVHRTRCQVPDSKPSVRDAMMNECFTI